MTASTASISASSMPQRMADEEAGERAAGEEHAERRAEGAGQHHAFHPDIVDAAALADDAAQGRKGDRHQEPQGGTEHVGQRSDLKPVRHCWRSAGR